MDNLTHTLVGALLGQAGLKRRSGLAMPALMIAANLPDIDAGCSIYGIESLAMRRGLTHGPPALLVLPLVLTGLLVWFNRWQALRGTRPADRAAVRPGWLFAVALIGCLSHPAFDWLNSYGIRLLEPFSSRWFHGDAVFIVDWVLLVLLGGGVWLSRRREKAGRAWTTPALAAAALVLAYIGGNIAISRLAAASAMRAEPYPRIAVANPVPLAFWRRDMLLGEPNDWQRRPWSLFSGFGTAAPITERRRCAWPGYAALAEQGAEARAFLFWSRMPFAEEGEAGRLRLKDSRFAGRFVAGRFSVQTALPCVLVQSSAASATTFAGR